MRYVGIQVTRLLKYVDEDNAEVRRLRGFHRGRQEVMIREDQDRDLGRYKTGIYTYEGLALKRSPKVNPTIVILGTLLHRS
jgi:hypothetical protein